MIAARYHFQDVTLLITHYNRNRSLEALLKSFRSLNCTFDDIVVADDGSKPEILERVKGLQQKYSFNLITSSQNKGLANNLNKGQQAVKTTYTLYVQEDFIAKSAFPDNFKRALQIITTDKSIDTIRFYSYFPYPHTESYDEVYDEMIFKPSFLKWSHLKFYVYSDHPHLRLSSFNEKFGTYPEGIHSDKAEFDMSLSFIKKGGKGLLAKNYTENFDQINSTIEPSTISRQAWKEKNTFLINSLKEGFYIYRYIKNTIQLLFKK